MLVQTVRGYVLGSLSLSLMVSRAAHRLISMHQVGTVEEVDLRRTTVPCTRTGVTAGQQAWPQRVDGIPP